MTKDNKTIIKAAVTIGLFIVVVALLVLIFINQSEPSLDQIQISDGVVLEHLGGEVIEEEPEPVCDEGEKEIVIDRDVFVLCLPEYIDVEGEQPLIGGSGVQVTMFFSDSSSLAYQTRDYENRNDPTIVDFSCLQNVSRLQWETCFDEDDELVTINDRQLDSGLNAIQATIDLKQTDQERLQRGEFIFIPGIQRAGKTYDVMIPIIKQGAAQAARLADSINLINVKY